MLATCFCAVAGTSNAATEIKPIVSDETVVLDIHEDFNSNKDQLAKLGITDYKDWRYSNEDQCYVLTLNNVHFVTTANVAIAFFCDAHETETERQSIIVKVVGENTIISGSNMVFKPLADEDLCAAIIAGTTSDKTSVNLIFEGDGDLVVSNNITSKLVKGTSAIVSDGMVAVLDKAVVLANGGDFTYYFQEEDYVEDARYFSYGVRAPDILVTSALIAVGGNVDVLFPPTSTIEPNKLSIYIISDGMYADRYAFIDAFVSGVGGEVYFGTTGFDASKATIKSHSSGIAIFEDSTAAKYDTYISGSKVIGKAGWTKGTYIADSAGIELGAKENGKVIIKDSILIGNGSTSECVADTSLSSVQSVSMGIVFKGPSEITGSFVSGASGELAIGGKENYGMKSNLLVGIFAGGVMTVNDSIINASGRGMVSTSQNLSFGIIASSEHTDDINVIDSEIYAAGGSAAIYANKINASLSPRAVYKLDSGSPVTITVDDMVAKIDASTGVSGPKSVELLYAYDVIIDSTLTGIVGFHRFTTDSCVVHSYRGFVPEGLQFAGYYMLVNGDVVNINIGQVVNLNSLAPTYIFATFEVAEKDNGNPAVAWIVVIVALIIVALLVVGVCVWKSRH